MHKGIELGTLDMEISEQVAKDFIDYRASKGKKYALTQRAFNAQMKNALEAHTIRMTPNEAIEYVMDQTSWLTIDVGYIANDRARKEKARIEATTPINNTVDKLYNHGNRWNGNTRTIESAGVSTRDIPLEHQLNDHSWADPQPPILDKNND